MIRDVSFGIDCNNCGYGQCYCLNYGKNLIWGYYSYWLNKIEITKDEKGLLIDNFDTFNLHRMKQGIIPVLLNYGNGLTMSNAFNIIRDKNKQPVAARVNLNMVNVNTSTYSNVSNGVSLIALDWKLFKKERMGDLRLTLDSFGLSQATIIDLEESKYLMVESDIPIYKCIMFRNNTIEMPSLEYLNKIIHDIVELDKINDRNRKLINSIYFAKTGKKLTREQAQNLSVTVTQDGYGIMVVDGESFEMGDGIQKNVIDKSLNNWNLIKDELNHFEEKFHLWAGMPTEKISTQRENLSESMMRTQKVNTAEKEFYKWAVKFIKEYEEYFETKTEYELDSTITNTINQNANIQKINTTSNENKLIIGENENE